MKWNGTVSQVGSSHIAIRLANAKPTQAMSSHANRRRGHSEDAVASSAIDPIPHAAHGPDQLRPELGPQSADVDVDHIGPGVEVVPPDRREQLLLGDRLASVPHQLAEHEKFALGKRDRAAAAVGLAIDHVELEASDRELGRGTTAGGD